MHHGTKIRKTDVGEAVVRQQGLRAERVSCCVALMAGACVSPAALIHRTRLYRL